RFFRRNPEPAEHIPPPGATILEFGTGRPDARAGVAVTRSPIRAVAETDRARLRNSRRRARRGTADQCASTGSPSAGAGRVDGSSIASTTAPITKTPAAQAKLVV